MKQSPNFYNLTAHLGISMVENKAAVKINKLDLYAATWITLKEMITRWRGVASFRMMWMDYTVSIKHLRTLLAVYIPSMGTHVYDCLGVGKA